MVIHVYILFINVNIQVLFGTNCLKYQILFMPQNDCSILFYFSESDKKKHYKYCLYNIYISSANTVVSLILVVPTLPTGAQGIEFFGFFHFYDDIIFYIISIQHGLQSLDSDTVIIPLHTEREKQTFKYFLVFFFHESFPHICLATVQRT